MGRPDPQRRSTPTDLDDLGRDIGLGPKAQRTRRRRADQRSERTGATPPPPPHRDPRLRQPSTLWLAFKLAASLAIIVATAGLIYREWHRPQAYAPSAAAVTQRRAELVLAAEEAAVQDLRHRFDATKLTRSLGGLEKLERQPLARVTVTLEARVYALAVLPGGRLRLHSVGDTTGYIVDGDAPSRTVTLDRFDPRAPLRILLGARKLGPLFRDGFSSLSLQRGADGAARWHGVWTKSDDRVELTANADGRSLTPTTP